MSGAIKDLALKQEEVKANNVAHGWYDETRSFSEDIALLHTELAETFDAYRSHLTNDATAEWKHTDDCLSANLGEDEMWVYHICDVPQPKPEGIGSEMADVLIRLLDTVERRGINLEHERNKIDRLEIKYEVATRSFGYAISSMHALLGAAWMIDICIADGDIGNLFGLLLYTLEAEADVSTIDLEWEYQRKMAYNRTRSYRHGNKHL